MRSTSSPGGTSGSATASPRSRRPPGPRRKPSRVTSATKLEPISMATAEKTSCSCSRKRRAEAGRSTTWLRLSQGSGIRRLGRSAARRPHRATNNGDRGGQRRNRDLRGPSAGRELCRTAIARRDAAAPARYRNAAIWRAANNFEGEADPAVMTLGMKTWVWISARDNDGRDLRPARADAFTLSFGGDGKLTATTDCNRVGGTYTAADGRLTFSGFFATRMYCEGAQEGAFTRLLEQTTGYRFHVARRARLGPRFRKRLGRVPVTASSAGVASSPSSRRNRADSAIRTRTRGYHLYIEGGPPSLPRRPSPEISLSCRYDRGDIAMRKRVLLRALALALVPFATGVA